MQWNRDNKIKLPSPQSIILEGSEKPACYEMPQMNLPPVFEIEDDAAHDSTAAKGRDGVLEIKGAVRAIGAVEGIRDRARKWLRAFRTKRRFDAHKFGFAFVAKIFAGSDIR